MVIGMALNFRRLYNGLKKAKDLKDKKEELDKKIDAAIRFKDAEAEERGRLARTMLGLPTFFDDVIGALSDTVEALGEVAEEEIAWPDDADCRTILAEVAKTVADHGRGSKQARAAFAAYAKRLTVFGKDLEDELDHLKEMKKQLPSRLKTAKQVESICRSFEKAFTIILKLPLPSDSLQAAMFGAFQDSEKAGSLATSVVTTLETIDTKLDAGIKEGDKLIIRNLRWIAWAKAGAELDEKAIKRNLNAETPR